MKRVVTLLVAVLGLAFQTNAQDKMMKDKMMSKDAKTIKLEQTPGEFTQKTVTVSAGTYIFEVANNGIDHNVGFVLVEKGKDPSKPENHIQTAYVTSPVGTDETQTSKPTVLEKGEYVYFCPLNPTSTDNILIVE
ncbi:MAG: plastocyanin/azurin family copper-binding protein [Bacteroidota bacterium]